MPSKNIPLVVLGGSGYVAGELIRLLVQHPRFDLRAVVSTSAVDQRIDQAFPHLAPAVGDRTFVSSSEAKAQLEKCHTLGLISALPHGEAASLISEWMEAAKQSKCELKVVDLSSDFRFEEASDYEKVYQKEHPVPSLLSEFYCGLPDLPMDSSKEAICHPGCFTTSVVLAATPLLKKGWVSPKFVVNSVTGSTGAGRQPRTGTHHPERHGGLWAYEPLRHRHRPEMEFLLNRVSEEPVQASFLPHSGPFARGIHSSLLLDLTVDHSESEIRAMISEFYRQSPFVQVRETWPSVKDVTGTNMLHLALRKEGSQLFVVSVIDNLTKGAAGGGVQWMNHLFGFDPAEGLLLPGVGWN